MAIGFRVPPARVFFDRKAVESMMDRETRKAYIAFGGLTRTIAIRSMRKRKGPSKPGEPPHSHRGLLRKFLFFAYERDSKTVVIGPELLTVAAGYERGTVPAALEYGEGTPGFRRKAPDFKIGDYGPVVVGEGRGRMTWTAYGKMPVVRATLRSQAQVIRARRLSEEYGIHGRPAKGQKVNIAARPYMRPAFAKAQEKLPDIWAKVRR